MKTSVLLTTAAIAVAGVAAPVMLANKAAAQATPVLPSVIPESEAVTLQAKITAINPKDRWVTLAGASGHQVTVVAGPAVRLDLLKVGDRVNAKYYRSVGFLVTPPEPGNAAPVSDNEIKQLLVQPVQAPGGIGVRVTKISATIVGIDMASHSVEVVDPSGGGIYTIDVTDPARIAKLGSLKVGDTVTAVITQALAVSIEPAPKSWF